MSELLINTKNGLYCPQADVFIDPTGRVDRAVITHGHADHARPGHQRYLCTVDAAPVIKFRLTSNINIQTLPYGASVNINGVKISFHPAGHIIGSAQVRLEYKGETWVVSGDYKLGSDGISAPFEPVHCHTFITESTFGMPIYQWKEQAFLMNEINDWWKKNQQNGIVSVIQAYSLGKAQRIIRNIDNTIGTIITHPSVESTNAVLRQQGINMAETSELNSKITKQQLLSGLIIAPPGTVENLLKSKGYTVSVAAASGWMAIQKYRQRGGIDKGFVLSDHADWNELNKAVKDCKAERVLVTHGYEDIFSKWLNEQGIEAHSLKNFYK